MNRNILPPSFIASNALVLLTLEPDSSPQDFAPVLNVPALISFVVIAIVFLSLQVRVTSIAEAADRRTQALEVLRKIKLQQLEGKATLQEVNDAVQQYQASFDEVERLRSVLPGVRIKPPPVTASLGPTKMDENTAAAKQFLGIEPSVEDNEHQLNKGEKDSQGLALPLVALLAVVALSQIGLLFLLATDPMSSSLDSSMTTNEVLNAVSGLE
jgi:hypothetical protein